MALEGRTVLVCGSRYSDHTNLAEIEQRAKRLLIAVLRDAEVHQMVSGGAPGVDRWAAEVAHLLGIDATIIRPQWRKDGVYNPRAGFERNAAMLALLKPGRDLVLAVWDGGSRGTRDTIDGALQAGLDLIVRVLP